jgi:hypothetical protein
MNEVIKPGKSAPPLPSPKGRGTSPHTTCHHACDCREEKFERLRKATDRLIAFMEWGLSPVEKAAAIIEAKEALEETSPR